MLIKLLLKMKGMINVLEGGSMRLKRMAQKR